MTWPLGRVTDVVIPASDDAHFSIWRLAWVAHQLPADPRHLFDANIFYPARGTLALSDAMLLVGALGTAVLPRRRQPGDRSQLSDARRHRVVDVVRVRAGAAGDRIGPCGVAGRGHLRTCAISNGAHRPSRAAVDDVDAARDAAAASAHGKADARARIGSRPGAGSASVLQHLLRTLPRLLSRGGMAAVDAVRKGEGKNRRGNGDRRRAAVACRRDLRSSPTRRHAPQFGERRADEVATYSAVACATTCACRRKTSCAAGRIPASRRTSGACSPGSSRYSSPSAPLFRHSLEPRSPT